MIDLLHCLVMPLMHHLVQQRLNHLVPAVPADMAAADNDLRAISLLPAQRVMPQPRFHPARHANGNRAQLSTEFREIELAVRASEITHEPLIGRMSALDRALLARRPRRATRLELE